MLSIARRNIQLDMKVNAMLRKQGMRANDMPLTARIVREKKGQYVVIVSFKQSARHLTDELVYANNIKQVQAHILRMYPTIKFGKK